ncbi:alkene reductase [Streptomyces canus]|uniref:alkene reductase n=1 Tax=Streptomyces canus TaxID=58343 RepID=UPI0022576D3A|nr:alkene reductase [Streptomyces canus]MCX5261978.1 alkene reductase [Streptomyces canus]
MADLFDEVKLGALTLPNRMVMAPLTRNRADPEGVPSPLTATYYAQRASAGLIISEGIQPSAAGQGFFATPGLHTREQIAGWRHVTDEVHTAGGRIYAQLMHAGRISHPALLRGRPGTGTDGIPLAPSAIRPTGAAKTYDGPREFVTPRAMTSADLAETVRDFADAARNAMTAGFDGVELHGGSGMLLHQFLAPSANARTDAYGGSVPGRIRFVGEVTEAVAEAVGADRVGLRVSPHNTFNDIAEPDAEELYPALVDAVAAVGIGYLHVYETLDRVGTQRLRDRWPTTFILNPHAADRRTPASSEEARVVLRQDAGDLISFGRLFISNPDLPRRVRDGLPLSEPDPTTFYGGDAHGYVDYPAHRGQPT